MSFLASSIDPLYPLRGSYPVSQLIYEIFEVDIFQYMICKFGKSHTFPYLQFKFEKKEVNYRAPLTAIVLGLLAIVLLVEYTIAFAHFIFDMDPTIDDLVDENDPNHEADHRHPIQSH